MKVRVPKEYGDLSPAARKRIEDYVKNVAFEAARETHLPKRKERFGHVRVLCKDCGEWCGGYTFDLKNTKKED